MSAIITLTGRLGAEPEMRFTPSGMAVVKLSIVTSRRVKDQNSGEWSDTDVTWWDCTGFKGLAENVASSLGKGMAVVATGRVVQENWEDKQTGQKRSKLAVRLDTIGPDLTRATATVQKAAGQAQQAGQRAAGANDDPWASSSPASAQNSGWGAPSTGYSEQPPF